MPFAALPPAVAAVPIATGGWELERPFGLALLALPLVLWILARRQPRPVSCATGTLGWWARLELGSAPAGARRRVGLDRATTFALAALLLGALALAGPRRGAERAPRRWTCVLDTSPSMGLPARAESSDGVQRTRLELGVRRALELLEQVGAAGDTVRWRRAWRSDLELALGEPPPADWLGLERFWEAEPRWVQHDEVDTLWITDRAPERGPVRAGLVAVGAQPVPGAIAGIASPEARAADGARILHWDGRRTESRPAPASERYVVLAAGDRGGGAGAGETLESLFRIWAEERGLTFTGDAQRADLVLETGGGPRAADEPRVELVGGRDRWRAVGPGPASGARPEGLVGPVEVWLASAEGLPLVVLAPGRVRLAWDRWERIDGDPAEVAVALGERLDEALLPARGVVPLAQRALVGDAVLRPPPSSSAASDEPAVDPGADVLAAWLAAAAGLCAVFAASFARGATLRRASPRARPNGP